jgi:hypothetical protein
VISGVQQGVAPRSAIRKHPPGYLAAGDSQMSSRGGAMGEERFAGIDWASEKHAVCVVDEQGADRRGPPSALQRLCTRKQERSPA